MNEKIHAHVRNEEGYRFNITFDELKEVKLIMDEPKPLGKSEGPTAAMMLSAAIGHCLSSSLKFCMEKSRAPVKDVAADVETSLARDSGGRWRVEGIKVKMKVTSEEKSKEKLDRCKGIFEDFCIVTASVRDGVKVDVSVDHETATS
jgi:uncharacterized OsmC-like protein